MDARDNGQQAHKSNMQITTAVRGGQFCTPAWCRGCCAESRQEAKGRQSHVTDLFQEPGEPGADWPRMSGWGRRENMSYATVEYRRFVR